MDEQAPKSSRTRLTLAQKASMLSDLDNGASISQMQTKFACSRRTVLNIKSQRETILQTLLEAPIHSKRKSTKGTRYPDIEGHLYSFVQHARSARLPLSLKTLRTQSLIIRDKLLATAASQETVDRLSSFSASPSWAQSFIKRAALRFVRLNGDAGSGRSKTVAAELRALREKLKDFDVDNIYNMDETALFFKLFPKRTYVVSTESEKTLRGTKNMKAKDRVSLYVCSNATGTAKVPMAMIGKALNPRCFRNRSPPIAYFSQVNAWSDTTTFKKWFHTVFLPFIRHKTSAKVALLMDNYGPHDTDLLDIKNQVTVLTLPPNCKPMSQPMGMDVIATLKASYKRALLSAICETFSFRDTLRATSKHMKVGTKGLVEGFDLHMLDAADILKRCWDELSPRLIALCCVKADILPRVANGDLIDVHDKTATRRGRPKKAVEIKKICSLLSTLRIVGEGINQSEIEQFSWKESDVERWLRIEEDEEVIQAMVNDAFEDHMTDFVETAGPPGHGEDSIEDREEGEVAEMDCEKREVPPPPEIAKAFANLEQLAEDCDIGDACLRLRLAKRAFYTAYHSQNASASKSRQTRK